MEQNLQNIGVPPVQSEIPESRQRNWPKITLFVFIALVLLAGSVYAGVKFVTSRHSRPSAGLLTPTPQAGFQITPVIDLITQSPLEQTEKFDIVVKENPDDKSKSDIYLKDKITGQESFFITLSDIYRSHYHNAEYHRGSLYIIHRTGGDYGYETNPNWTDELWRYDQQKQGKKLYSVRGLDFRVSNDEKLIAIITNEELNLLDKDGNKIKTFKANEVMALPEPLMFGFLAWAPNVIWLDNTFGPSLGGLVKIDTTTYSVTKYDLSSLPAGPEYALNVKKEKIVFSNYPALFDVEGFEEYEQSGAEVNLIVYDLKDKIQEKIATSITKEFKPGWIDEDTLEYNNPTGEGRLTKQIF